MGNFQEDPGAEQDIINFPTKYAYDEKEVENKRRAEN